MDPSAETADDLATTAVDDGSQRSIAARVFLVAGLLLVALAGSTLARGGAAMLRSTPFDLTINLVAAERLVERQPLYDVDASRAQAIDRSGPAMQRAYTVPTNSFPGLPSTALVHVPFLLGDDDAGYLAFRWVTILGMLGAVALVATTLPAGSRLAGGMFGAGALLASGALVSTIDLGQGHGFVMLGLGAAMWGVVTGRWRLVGVGLGVATALKLSPALILLYLAVRAGRRERRDLLVGAGATIGALAVAAAAVGRPADLWVWATEVAPSLSGGAYQVLNQSIPAIAARIFSSNPDFGGTADIGGWRHLALPMLAVATGALYALRRRRAIDPLEVGVLVLAGLVVGPLTWGHYATWAALPLVLLADPTRWTGRSRAETGVLGASIALAVVLLTVVVEAPPAAAIQADPALRVASSPYLVAFLLLLSASYRLVAPREPARPEVAPEALAARDLVAAPG